MRHRFGTTRARPGLLGKQLELGGLGVPRRGDSSDSVAAVAASRGGRVGPVRARLLRVAGRPPVQRPGRADLEAEAVERGDGDVHDVGGPGGWPVGGVPHAVRASTAFLAAQRARQDEDRHLLTRVTHPQQRRSGATSATRAATTGTMPGYHGRYRATRTHLCVELRRSNEKE